MQATAHRIENSDAEADVSSSAARDVDTVVIMPVFGQAQYLGEALDDVLAQETTANFKIVLIDDACPDPATAAACRKASAAMPNKVHYIRSRQNRGLSTVRNTGIEYALERWPEVFSILFFDGDDRMHKQLIKRSLTALRESANDKTASHPIGWVFEDADHFGKDGLVLRVHKYSALFSMAGCANTSSSMINADMFRSGLRYNENMVAGGEDWHFWLNALKTGFRGKYVPQLGFQYRRRPGSMAFHALKAADKNRTSIRISHPELFHPDFYLAEEKQEAPRYAVFTTDSQPVSIAKNRQISFPDLQALVRDIIASDRLPTHPVPQYVIFSTGNCLTDLDREGLLDWFLWRMEGQAKKSNLIAARIMQGIDANSIVSVDVDFDTDVDADTIVDADNDVNVVKDTDAVINTNNPSNSRATTNAGLFCVSTKWLAKAGKQQISLLETTTQNNYIKSDTSLRGVNAISVHSEFEQFIDQFNVLYTKLCQPEPQHNFDTWVPFGHDRFDLSEHFFGATPLLPIDDGCEKILCLVREEELNGDTQLRENIIDFVKQCKVNDRSCTLLTLGNEIDRSLAPHFDRLLLVKEKLNHLRMVAEAGDEAFLGLLLPFGSVISFGAMDYAADLNQLRRYGRKVFCAFTGRKNNDQLINTDLINCFKVFTNVLCTDENAEFRAQALGVSEEQIVRHVQEVIDMARGLADAPE